MIAPIELINTLANPYCPVPGEWMQPAQGLF